MRVRLIGVAFVVAFANATVGQGQALARSAHFVNENDSFDFWIAPDKRTDDNYTQGARVARDLVSVPAFARRLICRQHTACGSSLEIGQEIYTPTNYSSVPLAGERSFAGWLYARGNVIAATSTVRREVALTIGMTGPASLAEFAQERVHRVFWPYSQPLGWAYQLPTEPDMALQLTQGWYLARSGPGVRWIDVVPTAHATLGTLRTAVGAGTRLRAGFHLDHPWLIDVTPHAFTAYAFIGASGEAVERDLFLDGDTFRPSLHRDHKPLVGNLERGAGVRAAHIGIEYRAVTQSKEYQAGPDAHTFGGITLTWWMAR